MSWAPCSTAISDEDAEFAREGLVQEKGFFIPPSERFCNVRQRAPRDENLNKTPGRVFNNIESSTIGGEFFTPTDASELLIRLSTVGRTEVNKVYDDGYSGTDFTRPAHVQMMADVKAGKLGNVIVKDYCAIIGLNQKDLENQGILVSVNLWLPG